jgi:hypothetical protein
VHKIDIRGYTASIGASVAAYAMLGASVAFAAPAPVPGPAPLIGAVGGPAGLLAAGVVYGGYLAVKRFRERG